jgi:tetratricopeptide (TPR) repeat protein
MKLSIKNYSVVIYCQENYKGFRKTMNLLSNIHQFARKNYDYLILGFLIVFMLTSNLVWLRIDNSMVENRDSTVYLSRTMQFIESVNSPNFNLMEGLRKLSLAGRPVLLQLVSIPFLLWFGYSIDTYTYFNFLFYILLVVATYNIGRNLKDRNAGLLAAVLVSFYPTTVRLLKIPLTSFAIIACSALTIWLLLNFLKTRSVRDIWLTNLSVAFGFLVHPSFLWGVSIPASFLMLYSVFFGADPKWITRPRDFTHWFMGKLRQPVFLSGLLPAALSSIGLILMWYVPFGSPMLEVTSKVSSYIPEGTRLFLGPSYPDIPYPLWLIVTSGLALSTILAILFWVSLVARSLNRQPQAFTLTFLFIGIYITQVAAVSGMGWRYFAQALPIMAVLTAEWVVSVRSRLISIFLAVICVAGSVFNFMIVSWGVNPTTKPIATLLGLRDFLPEDLCRPSYALYCADPPSPEEWPIHQMLDTILGDSACKDGNCKLEVIPGNIYFYQAVPFTAAIEFPDAELEITILLDPGVWGTDVEVPQGFFNLPSLLESEFIVYNLSDELVSNGQLPSPELFSAVTHFFDAPPPLFSASHQVVAEYLVPNGTKALLYKRIQPLTLEEAEQAVSALELPEEDKVLKYGLFLRLSKKEEDVAHWLESYKEALSAAQKPEPYLTLLIGLADYYQSAGELDLAVDGYEEALAMDANNLTVQLNLSRIYLEREDCKNAIPHLVEVARLQPIALRYVNLGDAYRDCGDYENAIASYRKALRIDPQDVRAHLGLALTYVRQHQVDRARQEFNTVIQLAPNSIYGSQAETWLEANKNK